MYPCKTPCGDIDCLDSCMYAKGKSLEEVAEKLGISHQRVSQLQQSALKKIRTELLKNNITYEELLSCLKYS
jgi:DNA-directed RNA polymerase sigma subunit (sigma70/sigma32)